jgi:hypothetical protein
MITEHLKKSMDVNFSKPTDDASPMDGENWFQRNGLSLSSSLLFSGAPVAFLFVMCPDKCDSGFRIRM